MCSYGEKKLRIRTHTLLGRRWEKDVPLALEPPEDTKGDVENRSSRSMG